MPDGNEQELDRQVPIGAAILTSDGDQVGTVAAVQAGSSKDEAPWQPDSGLALRCVQTVTEDRVELYFLKAELADHKTSYPLPS